MRFTRFDIRNFKGVKEATLKLGEQCRIFTLVGLNESGKTTLLEAMNSFSPDDTAEFIHQSQGDVFRRVEGKDLVHKHKKDNFTGKVRIAAYLEFTDEDKKKIAQYLIQNHGFEIDLEKLGSVLKVEKYFSFEQSDYKSQGSYWTINLAVKSKRQRQFRLLKGEDGAWQDAVNYIRTLIPSICYFPTLLFDFPSRVYLSNVPERSQPRNEYYRQIVQDILDSLKRKLTIEEHIVKRIEEDEKGDPWGWSFFFGSDRKEQVEAVMGHLGNAITTSVFTKWDEIFRATSQKNIKIDWGIEEESSVYLGFRVQEGMSMYEIAERSLGFRWFFCFLLFTQFRESRQGGGTLFLLDEPASNLHATAQQKLLESFETIMGGNNNLIYSTHSHYMINPRWLEGAFIVQNGAIEYDEDLSTTRQYESHETDIRVTPYKTFVGNNSDKVTYYQPILNALDYKPSILEHDHHTVMVEGITDFYAFAYFSEVVFCEDNKLRFLPSSGAGSLGPLVSLYLGWGYSFKILLDDDQTGQKSKGRYMDKWSLGENVVKTLGDVSEKLGGKKLETLISEKGLALIAADLKDENVSKNQIALFFQSKLALKEKFEFDPETRENFRLIIDALKNGWDDA